MILSSTLKVGNSTRLISINVPIMKHPLLPVPYVDSRWARPSVFHDITRYPLAEISEVQNDFKGLVDYVNNSATTNIIDRYKEGLLKIVDEHITKHGRLLFCDLLLYVDCLAYLCYASDLMKETEINDQYASWAKYVVNNRTNSIMSSTRWGITYYSGSDNERDLNSIL